MAFILAAVIGLIISLVGIVGVWWVRPRVVKSSTTTLSLSIDLMKTTGHLLRFADTSATHVEGNLDLIQQSVITMSNTLHSTSDVTMQLSGMFSTDLPKMVTQMQSSLTSMESAAGLVDSTMKFVSAIPFSGITYNPDQPLAKSVSAAADSLAPLPDKLQSMQTNIQDTASGIDTVRLNMIGLAAQLGDLRSRMVEINEVALDYLKTVETIQANLEALQRALPAILAAVTGGATLILLWFLVVQFLLFKQGMELLRGKGQLP